MTVTEPHPSQAATTVDRILHSFRRSEWGLLVAILAVLVLTTVLDQQHNYLEKPWESAVIILRQTALLGIFALGSAIVIISGGIDLSSGSVIAFSGSICATLLVLLAPDLMKPAYEIDPETHKQVVVPIGLGVLSLAILGALVVGLLIGSLHAWLITVVGLPPFIATLATLVGLRSLARAIIANVTEWAWGGAKSLITIYDTRLRYLATSVWIPVVLFVILAILTWILLSRTVVGRHLYALGGNEQAARLAGIRTDRLKWLAYCISAVLASLAGILYIGDESSAQPQTQGLGYELNAIAACVVGGCSLQGGIGTIPGTVLGVLFLRIVINGVANIIKTGADVYEGLIVGGVVVVAVAFTQLREAGWRGKRFFAGPLGIVTAVNLALVAGALVILLGPTTAIGSWPLGLAAGTLTGLVLLLRRFLEDRRANRALVAGLPVHKKEVAADHAAQAGPKGS
jgi:ribose/xylose/arabinose/galactoside ABC-type transport system permease subunit